MGIDISCGDEKVMEKLLTVLKLVLLHMIGVDILTSPDVLQCGFLIDADETFRTGETLQRNKNHVEMRDRLQEAYEALFLKTGRVDVGKMTFSNHTREYLYEAESILISDNKFDFE